MLRELGRTLNIDYRMVQNVVKEEEFKEFVRVIDGNDRLSLAELDYLLKDSGETKVEYLLNNTILSKESYEDIIKRIPEERLEEGITRISLREQGTGIHWGIFRNSYAYYEEKVDLETDPTYKRASKKDKHVMLRLKEDKHEKQEFTEETQRALGKVSKEVVLSKTLQVAKENVGAQIRLSKVFKEDLAIALRVVEELALGEVMQEVGMYDYISRSGLLAYLEENRFNVTVDKVLKHYRTNYNVVEAAFRAYEIDFNYYTKKSKKEDLEDSVVKRKLDDMFRVVHLRDVELKTFDEIGEICGVKRQSAHRTYNSAKKRYGNLFGKRSG